MTPQTLEGIRELVASLPPWRIDMDDDPLWLCPLSDFGIQKRSHVDSELDRVFTNRGPKRYNEILNLDDEKWTCFDPELIKKSGQEFIRLDTLLHYMENQDDLWDPDGWYGTRYPVIVRWKDNYLIFDGNHRIVADRLMGRASKVLLTEL